MHYGELHQLRLYISFLRATDHFTLIMNSIGHWWWRRWAGLNTKGKYWESNFCKANAFPSAATRLGAFTWCVGRALRHGKFPQNKSGKNAIGCTAFQTVCKLFPSKFGVMTSDIWFRLPITNGVGTTGATLGFCVKFEQSLTILKAHSLNWRQSQQY